MKTLNLKKLVCTALLLGVVSSAGYGQVPAKMLGNLFLTEAEEILSHNIADISFQHGIRLAIARGLEKASGSYVLKTNTIQPLTKQQVWPDEAEARFVLKAYVQGNIISFDHATPKDEWYIHSALSVTPEKYIYKRMSDEKELYQPEIDAAFDVFSVIHRAKYNHSLDNAAVAMRVNEFIDKQVVSEDLRGYLKADIEAGNYDAFLTDVSDYYGVENLNETEAALGFLQRHPHGRTLALKRALHSPFTPSSVKTTLRSLLQTRELSAADRRTLHQELVTLFTAQRALYQTVSTSDAIKAQKQVLVRFANDLEKFLTDNGRMPVWNARNNKERRLANDWGVIKQTRRDDNFGTLSVYYNQIEDILAKYNIHE